MPGPSSAEEPWPVRTVSRLIGDWVARLGTVWVEGQVTGLSRRPGASVAFVTLRDPAADVSLTMTATPAILDAAETPLAEGQQVVVHAKPSWYLSRGTLSLQAVEIRAVGLGALLARLERLRALLAQEGLFAPERKRPLPFLPRVVGLVCGRESDAEHDVVENARRRWAAVRFEIREVPVQGPYAVTSVIDALASLDRHPEVDVIVVARGGGDVQELLPFSDEALLRAVAATRTPVVSAIGHEQHTPLLDLVADRRASTPTDAGKIVVPDVAEEQQRILALRRAAWRCVAQRIEREQAFLNAARSRPVLADPHREVDRRAAEVVGLSERARRVVAHRLDQESRDVTTALARVTALSPKATLDRGYAVVQRPDGGVVTSAAGVEPGTDLAVRLADGALDVTVSAART
ncbi:MAG: exodeoxyribonuclease large subunit [Frankiaceae bacterium]|jgi:exodeoxyribonuclease VII large subunit|nr:exodeoxyribonuclease large subunit [Frankiaceae bacterium]